MTGTFAPISFHFRLIFHCPVFSVKAKFTKVEDAIFCTLLRKMAAHPFAFIF